MILWRRKWQPTPVLLPGKSHGQRSLVGYSPWSHKESGTTGWPHSLTLLRWWKKVLEYMFGGVGIILFCSQEHRNKKRQRWWNTRRSACRSRAKGGMPLFIQFFFPFYDVDSYFSFSDAKHIKQRSSWYLLRDLFVSSCSVSFITPIHLHRPLCYIYICLTHLIKNIVKNLQRLPLSWNMEIEGSI